MPQPALSLLMVEQHLVLRSTVVAVAKEIKLARIDEATSVASAEQRLMIKRYDGLLLSMDETDTALALLARLRAGGLPAPARLPVLVMAASCDAVLAAELKRHEVRRVLIKPFKAKTLLQSIEVLALEPADSPLA